MDFSIDKIQELINQDYTIVQIAKYFQVSKPTISNFLKKNNIYTKTQLQRIKIQQINAKEISKKYLSGKTIKELEKEYGVFDSVIKRSLNDTNTKTRTNSESHTKYPCNYNYFNFIDNYNKAYLLGFICADGWTTNRNEVGIAVKIDDKNLIEFFAKELESQKPFTIKENAIELRLQNEKLYKTLENYGIIPNKSLVLNIENVIQKANITNDLIPAFLLGYFDGDGGIYEYIKENSTPQYSCSITGTYETCSYYQKYFDNIGFFTKRHQDDKNNYTYQIGGRNQVKHCLSKLYTIKDNLTFYYKRKYDIFTKL